MADEIALKDSRAVLALPPGGKGPGILVLHAWWGLTPFFAGLCDRLAEAGYVALAPDLYRDGATAVTIPEAEALLGDRDGDFMYTVITRAIALLKSKASGDALGVLGFSMGANWALSLTDPAIKAIVAFYGTQEAAEINAEAALLCHFAADDAYEPPEYVQAMLDGLHEKNFAVTAHTYPGTQHWFFEDNRPEYNAAAANLAWDRTLVFLGEHLTKSAGGGRAGFG